LTFSARPVAATVIGSHQADSRKTSVVASVQPDGLAAHDPGDALDAVRVRDRHHAASSR
jgi:hypothetical protein